MRGLLAAALGVVVAASPASASLVEITTSVAVSGAGDQLTLRRAVESAVDELLRDGIDFTPTLIVLTHAVRVGDRLYLRLLLADRDGERAYRERSGDGPVDRAPAAGGETWI